MNYMETEILELSKRITLVADMFGLGKLESVSLVDFTWCPKINQHDFLARRRLSQQNILLVLVCTKKWMFFNRSQTLEN